MEVDAPEGAVPKKKRVTQKRDVPFFAGTASLDKSIVEKYKELEGQMHESDKLVMDTEVIVFVALC